MTSGLSGFFVTIRYLSKNNEIKKFDNISDSIMSKNGIFSFHCFQSDKEMKEKIRAGLYFCSSSYWKTGHNLTISCSNSEANN